MGNGIFAPVGSEAPTVDWNRALLYFVHKNFRRDWVVGNKLFWINRIK